MVSNKVKVLSNIYNQKIYLKVILMITKKMDMDKWYGIKKNNYIKVTGLIIN